MARSLSSAYLAAAAGLLSGGITHAQCNPQWSNQFAGSDIDNAVGRAATVWDDGTGPGYYVIGYFRSVGEAQASGIAKWDGAAWSPLGAGLNWTFSTSAWKAVAGVEGGGPAAGLYVRAYFTSAGGQPATPIVRWDGHAWSNVPGSTEASSRALIGFDADGPGPQVAVLHSAGRIWDGQTWTESGLTGTIWKYYVLDEDGAGPLLPRLYAAGTLSFNGTPIGPIARLEGSAWVGVGTGVGGIMDMSSWDEDGPGPLPKRLCILGAGGVHKLVNDSWVQVAPYPGSSAYTLAAVDEDGDGPLLPTLLVGIDHAIRRLSAGAWTTIGALHHTNCSCADVYGFNTFDPLGPEPERVFAAGYFSTINGISCRGVSKWDGQTFSGLAPARGLAGAGLSLLTFDEDGPGPQSPALFVGGDFVQAGSVSSPGVSRWSNQSWSPLGGGVTGGLYNHVGAIGEWDHDGEGPSPASLIVGGSFGMAGGVVANSIARWDGTLWHALGSGFVGENYPNISDVAAFDEDGPGPSPAALFAVGTFSTAGGIPAEGIARWNGAAWSAVGSLPTEAGYCTSLAVFDEDGPGSTTPALYVGTRAGAGLYRWNGESWSVVGGGVRSFDILVSALAVIDNDGPGPNHAALYVGGNFTEAGTTAAQGIARWDGQNWSAMGTGLGAPFTPYQIESIAAIDRTGGAGAPTIHVGGSYLGAGLGGLARWDPEAGTWLPVAGAPVAISALATFDDDGFGPESMSLYAAGNFTMAGAYPSSGIARLHSNCTCYANCDNSSTPPILNVNDFICFNGRYAAGSSLANCDASSIPPVLNVNDFICFMGKFAAGCP